MIGDNLTMKIVKKFKGVIIAFLLCFAIPFTLFFVINEFFLYSNNTFTTGFTICGIDIGGLTKVEAEQKLTDYFETQEKPIKMEIKYNNQSWLYTEKDFQIKSNIHTVLDSAYQTNHNNSYFQKLKNLKKINKMGFKPEISINYTFLGIDDKVNSICNDIEKEPIDCKISFNKMKNNFDISKSEKGIKVDKEKLFNDIYENLQKSNDIKICVNTFLVNPTFGETEAKKATKKQAEFSTNYSSSNSDRKNNIKVATNSINGYCIQPGEEFSFNSALGVRSIENGYKQANIIKDGEFVKGVGGGICQVSTTLYNALLLSNVNVTEVNKHSLPVSYVKPGLDAMVSWGSADLKFTNTTSLPMFIVGKCDGKTLSFSIYGNTKSPNLTIKTKSEIVKKIPHKGDKILPDTNGQYSDKILFKGEFYRLKHPKEGYEAKAYLQYYIDNEFSHEQQIRHSIYDSQQGIVYEGCDILPEGMSLPKENFTLYTAS